MDTARKSSSKASGLIDNSPSSNNVLNFEDRYLKWVYQLSVIIESKSITLKFRELELWFIDEISFTTFYDANVLFIIPKLVKLN